MNYLIPIPMYQSRSEEIGETLIESNITKYGIPEYIIMNQESAFLPFVMNYLFIKLNIKTKTVAPYNYQ